MTLRLTIDGQSVTELDWKCLHPSMLYEAEGVTPPADAYDIGGDWHRNLVKVALMILINAPSWKSAVYAITHDDEMSACAPVGSPDAVEVAKLMIQKLKAVHRPIERWFHSDAGSRLMLRDSVMAQKVLRRMMDRGIVCLPIHDSFLVQRSWKDVLEEVMTDVAQEEGLIDLKVEENILDPDWTPSERLSEDRFRVHSRRHTKSS